MKIYEVWEHTQPTYMGLGSGRKSCGLYLHRKDAQAKAEELALAYHHGGPLRPSTTGITTGPFYIDVLEVHE